MEITEQINSNECGICVINSFIKHYYKIDKKLELLNDANLKTDGLSLFDFEKLCLKNGLEAASYEIKWNEFETYESNKYFSLLLREKEGCHYVVALKKGKEIKIFDSCHGEEKAKIEEIKEKFAGVLIEIEKTSFKIEKNQINAKKLLKRINFKFFSISLIIRITLMAFLIIENKYFQIIIDKIIPGKEIDVLCSISFIFILIGVFSVLEKYIFAILGNKEVLRLFLFYSDLFFEKLKLKNNSFFEKISKNNLFYVRGAIFRIASFITVDVNTFIVDILTLMSCSIVVMIYQPWSAFLIIACISFNSLLY
jgi:ABC-type bacteriocin/lantibiotic exporter with double-glycine peptidase domain